MSLHHQFVIFFHLLFHMFKTRSASYIPPPPGRHLRLHQPHTTLLIMSCRWRLAACLCGIILNTLKITYFQHQHQSASPDYTRLRMFIFVWIHVFYHQTIFSETFIPWQLNQTNLPWPETDDTRQWDKLKPQVKDFSWCYKTVWILAWVRHRLQQIKIWSQSQFQIYETKHIQIL